VDIRRNILVLAPADFFKRFKKYATWKSRIFFQGLRKIFTLLQYFVRERKVEIVQIAKRAWRATTAITDVKTGLELVRILNRRLLKFLIKLGERNCTHFPSFYPGKA